MSAAKIDSTRVSSACELARVAIDNWEAVQVELQGKYSLERVRALYAYSIQSRWHQILFWCIVTPIPCLVINIALDAAPLAQPSAGRDANYVFWARMAVFTVIIDYWMLMQSGYLTPTLGMKPRHALSTAIVVTIACIINGYVLAGLIAMPVPFLLLTGTPAYLTPTMIMFGFYFGRRLKNDAALRASFNRAGAITGVQLALLFIYPAFIYGFNSIPSKYQTLFMILIPVIKLIAKNIMSRLVGSNDDLKPVELIFNIDCFNAIYVSLAMQRATTISTSLIVMLIDIMQGCVSVYDVYQRFQPIKRFMNMLPTDHPLKGKHILDVAIAFDQQESGCLSNGKRTDNVALTGPALRTKSVKPLKMSTSGLKASAKVFVAPRKVGSGGTVNGDSASDICIGNNLVTSESRAAFLHATRKLLFTTEFVILVEYTEVTMPAFYSLLIAATYHLPNRAFYSSIAGINVHELWSMVASVLMYAALELLTLIAMGLVVYRITGISPMRQVGFVLDTHREMVQSKLLSWVMYSVQNALQHYGADFSFQFKWLHSH